jgi:hypothetical protein
MTTSGKLKDGVITCVGTGVTAGGEASGGEDAGGVSAGEGDAGGVTTVTHPTTKTVTNIKTIKIFLIEYLLLSGRPDTVNKTF